MTARLGSVPTAPRYVSLLNPLLKLMLRLGVPLGPNALVTITGRTSGIPRTTPIAVIDVGGHRWIWSPWGEVHWVRNLRAAGQATIDVHGRVERVRATELSPEERLAFFRDVMRPYAHRLPFGVTFVKLIDGVDVDDPAGAADGRVVFELTSLEP
jgi:deazaflavin-dependent oxidoreductase (nitroreductase family)